MQTLMHQIMVTQPAEETEQGDVSMHHFKEQAKIKTKTLQSNDIFFFLNDFLKTLF